MKLKITLILLAISALLLTGCEDCDNNDLIFVEEDVIPATPQSVFSITGDNAVWIYWNGIYEHDVRSYSVYRSNNPYTGYTLLAGINAVDNPNLDLLVYEYADFTADNGSTYWYAVTSVDYAGQESELSAEDVFDTPRPEGIESLYPEDLNASLAGFYLEGGSRVPASSENADVWMDRVDGVYYLNVGNMATDIQDMGFTQDFDEISYAPDLGWSQLGYVEIILGHTYVIWTDDYHFAKMRTESINASESVTFRWAWQSDEDNGELMPGLVKPMHTQGYLRDRSGDDRQLR